MPDWEIAILALIPVYGWIYFIVFSFLLEYFYRLRLAREASKTEDFLISPEFGLVVYIKGHQGAGKTTLGAGLTNVMAKIEKKKAEQLLLDVRTDLNRVIDFKKIDGIIEQDIIKLNIWNTEKIKQDIFNNYQFCFANKERVINRYGFPSTLENELTDYIDAKGALIRDNFVYFNNGEFYQWDNGHWALAYNPSMIDIKTAYANHDYALLRNIVIFEDEKLLSGKSNLNRKALAKEDGGSNIFFTLIRHLGKGSIHYLTTAQNFRRAVLTDRELATGVINVLGLERLQDFNFKEIVANDLLALIDGYILAWKQFSAIFGKSPYPRPLIALRAKLRGIVARQTTDGFLRYKIEYNSSVQGGDDSKGNNAPMQLVLPLAWCFYSINSWAYSWVQGYLEADSQHVFDFEDDTYRPDLQGDRNTEIEALLKKIVK